MKIWAVFFWGSYALLTGCAMTRGPVTKQALEPPYASERHGGMDGAVYLRVTEHEGEWK